MVHVSYSSATADGGSAGVLVITGAMAVGKSTVAQAVAERLPAAAHVRGDLFRRMIVSGRASTDPPFSPSAAAQLRLRHRNAAVVADEYAAAGITAVVQDLYLGPDLLPFLQQLRSRPLWLVVLTTPAAILAVRDAARGSTGYGDWSPKEFAALVEATPRLGLRLDTSSLSVDATVGQILTRLDEARLHLPPIDAPELAH